ncbi:MAG TPA: hypothetical protein VEU51_06985, partial [Candidatus Acidoferrales bacterium]|nr:hypothetical protein [Candidatus Acidoferrales bacterium]
MVDAAHADEPIEVAKALLALGAQLESQRRDGPAIAAYDAVATRFGEFTDDAKLQEMVAVALLRKGLFLAHLERRREAIAVFEGVITRFAGARDQRSRNHLALPMFHIG